MCCSRTIGHKFAQGFDCGYGHNVDIENVNYQLINDDMDFYLGFFFISRKSIFIECQWKDECAHIL
jgi:hypothetical protein